MCITCGCGSTHHEKHAPHPPEATTLSIETEILDKNERFARANRALFAANNIYALNLLGSPGSGKTSILEMTLRAMGGSMRCAVIEGDQQTDRDALRIAATGVAVRQVNTGAGCHLDALMVCRALKDFDLPGLDMLFMENVGNLVCPAAFHLGEHHKVVVLSVTEGEDKPLKYPQMFRAAEVMLLNKIDLLPHLDFDVEQCKEMARRVNPAIIIFEVSGKSGAGMDDWYHWLRQTAATGSEEWGVLRE